MKNLTVKDLIDIMKENNIPMDATITSDSGWECCATYVSTVFYDKNKNEVVLCQDDPNFEHRLGQLVLVAPENKTYKSFPYDYGIDELSNMVVITKDKRAY